MNPTDGSRGGTGYKFTPPGFEQQSGSTDTFPNSGTRMAPPNPGLMDRLAIKLGFAIPYIPSAAERLGIEDSPAASAPGFEPPASTGNRFRDAIALVRARQEHEDQLAQKRAAAQAAARAAASRALDSNPEEIARRQRLAQRTLVKQERDDKNLGTPPEEVFAQPGARLCQEFLEAMREIDFPRITPLGALRGEDPVIRGYPIGFLRVRLGADDQLSYHQDPDGTDGSNVFLCEDGNLRMYGSDPVRRINGVLLSLPLDKDGKSIPPLMGYHSSRPVLAEVPGEASQYFDEHFFVPRNLEQTLLALTPSS